MDQAHPLVFVSGDLRICPELGQIVHSRGEDVRLGPVNMKVLSLLLEHAGLPVSRADLFDAVWPNQAVGEDALTRCISDIRGELRKLSGRDDLIETIPKRGYRWVEPVQESRSVSQPSAQDSVATDRAGAPGSGRGRLPRLLGRGIAYLVALAVMGSLIVWSIDRFAGPGLPVVAVLPVQAPDSEQATAAALGLELTDYLMELDQVQLLSRSAVDARPANPFPFFYYEFGARWLIESQIHRLGDQTVLTVAVVDARTGFVEIQASAELQGRDADSAALSENALAPIRRFFDAAGMPDM